MSQVYSKNETMPLPYF
uniref:Uncharacterized protein n=1 Tax=Anguilla anguilla TaxID=7936 RepID=A0A0E9UZ59_ANGAN